MAYERRVLVGVGGWLALLIVSLVLSAIASVIAGIGILTGSADLLSRFGVRGEIYIGISCLMAAALAGGYGYLAWRLNAVQTAKTPPLVIKGLWIAALVPALIDAIAGAVLLDLSAASVGSVLGGGIVRPIIYAIIWSAYLTKSERVANTYTDDSRELAAVFS